MSPEHPTGQYCVGRGGASVCYLVCVHFYLKERESSLRTVPSVYIHSSHVLPLPICGFRSGVEPGFLTLWAAHHEEISVDA